MRCFYNSLDACDDAVMHNAWYSAERWTVGRGCVSRRGRAGVGRVPCVVLQRA